MVPAVVLAAGASSRMGSPKALLKAWDRTFVRRILDTLRLAGVERAVVVTRPDSDEVVSEVRASGFGHVVENPRPDQGQLSSLITGLNAVDAADTEAVLVTLVDIPLIAPASIRTLLDRAAISGAPIVRVVHRGRHGHPVIFKRDVFDALRRADAALGAKVVMRAFAVEDVEVDDPGVLHDVDTPADYERLSHRGGLAR